MGRPGASENLSGPATHRTMWQRHGRQRRVQPPRNLGLVVEACDGDVVRDSARVPPQRAVDFQRDAIVAAKDRIRLRRAAKEILNALGNATMRVFGIARPARGRHDPRLGDGDGPRGVSVAQPIFTQSPGDEARQIKKRVRRRPRANRCSTMVAAAHRSSGTIAGIEPDSSRQLIVSEIVSRIAGANATTR
jgi:hypothetical protein